MTAATAPVSAAPAHRRASRLSPSRWTLRSRLLVALIGLLTMTTAAIGLITVIALNHFLVGQLDEQLISAVNRSQAAFNRTPDGDHDDDERRTGPDFLVAPGQATGTLGAQLYNGNVIGAAVLDASGTPVPLSSTADLELSEVPVTGVPVSADLEGGLGDYRVVAVNAPNGSVLLTGLPLRPVENTVEQLSIIITVVAVAGLLAAAAAGAVIIRKTLAPLRRVAGTATQVAGLPLDSGEVALAVRVPEKDTDPHTEVGQVGAAINHMLANVAAALQARHESELKIRSFVADASHELRTPLASIRGYAELTRRSDAELPPDAANALGRIESESIRMTSLVEDLLLLARLDAGRPIEFRPVDLSQLLVGCGSDAHAAGPDHQWQLDLPDEPLTVIGDGDRLQQVIANLLTNARVHTPAGTLVQVWLRPGAAGQTELIVRDNGPGIPADLVPGVFERFSRGDSSRSRAAGSTGLGLAIVAAVVGAHQGSITVNSRPGETTFTVRLPNAGASV